MPEASRILPTRPSTENWKREMQNAITSPAELLRRLGLDARLLDEILPAPRFRCLVPPAYLEKIAPGSIDDPLLRQVLPLKLETRTGGRLDPVGDLDYGAGNGLIHKYPGRALLITTGACAIHCRYCFRRHYPYSESGYQPHRLDGAIAYLRQRPDIDEIILSGGDPLMLDDDKLGELIDRLETVSTLHSLRLHTRLPVVLASRITTALLDRLRQSRFRITLVIHANHANELAEAERAKLTALHHAGITLLNQSVLLRGVNDTVTSLVELSRRLHHCHTLPYYLHLLDPVQGAMHFDVGEQEATCLVAAMRQRLPGYLVPRLVREIPGKDSKTAIFSI